MASVGPGSASPIPTPSKPAVAASRLRRNRVERDSAIGEAFRKGFRAAWQNLPAILALQGAMAAIVAIYYCWPLGASYLGRYAEWQQSGGILVAALATACAGGILSEISLVYFQQAGHWTRTNLENVAFKWILFFISGAITYE